MDSWIWVAIGILTLFSVVITIVTLSKRKQSSTDAPVINAEPVIVLEEIRYASLWERFLAVFIDGLILIPVQIPSLILSARDSDYATLSAVLATVVEVVYYVYFEYKRGQTPGKKLMKIKVISDGGVLTLNSVCIRNIFRFASLLQLINTFSLYLYLFWTVIAASSIASSPKKQRPLDMLAKTVVIKVS